MDHVNSDEVQEVRVVGGVTTVGNGDDSARQAHTQDTTSQPQITHTTVWLKSILL